MLNDVRERNDLGHPLCGNLRDGNWLPEYIAKRLKVKEGTRIVSLYYIEVTCII